MKWTKPSAETVAYFERIAPGPPLETRRMFGMPARFLNGHMLVGVFGDTFMLHLSAADRADCIRAGAKPFAPMGREAREYVDVAPGTFDDRTLKEWIVRGMRYLGSLPPKLGAKRGKPVPKPDGAGAPRASMPAKRTVAPAKRTAAPAKRTAAPAKRTAALAKRTAAPAKRRVVASATAQSAAKRTAKNAASPRAGAKKAKTAAKKTKTRR